MTNGNEASRAASQARKEKETTKKKEGKHETDSSDDSDDDKATEKAAQKLRENERKRRLAQADADSEITDRMIAQAEARNQAKKAKLKLCWPIFSRTSTSKLSGRRKFKKFGFVDHSDLTTNLQEWV